MARLLRTQPPRRRQLLAAVALVVLVSGGVAVWQQHQLVAQLARNERLQEVLVEIERRERELSEVRSRIDESLNRMRDSAEQRQQRQWPATLLRILAVARPEGLGLDQVVETREGLTLSGRAQGYEAVSQFVAKLAESAEVQRVDLLSLEQTAAEGGLLVFRMNIGIASYARPLSRGYNTRYVGSALGDPK